MIRSVSSKICQKKVIYPVLFFLIFILFIADSYSITLISKESELEMGRGGDRQVIQQYGIYQDKVLQLYVNEIGQKLISNLSDQEFQKFFFKIVDSSEINAFALPGGYIYVTRGILALLNSEAELAGVLGHEIGHVIFHHGAKAIVRNIGAQILSIGGAIASPKNAGKWVMLSSQLFQQMNLGYGRDAELESDAHGIVSSFEAGYNPKNMAGFLKSLRRQEIMSGQSYHSFQATHPDTKDRIVRADTMALSMSYRDKPVVDNRHSYLTQLRGLVYGGKRHARDPASRNYKPMHIDIYEVQPGDTYERIAENDPAIESRPIEIATMNGLRDTDPIVPGQLLKIVKKGIFEGKQFLYVRHDSSLKQSRGRR